MVKVSNLFKQRIYSPERTIKAKVSFEILDIEAYEDASYTVSGESEISRISQIINKIREMSQKYATFERDYFQLNGEFVLPPKEHEGDGELGWWSDVLSGDDGRFIDPYPTLEFNFANPHSSIGLTITFDDKSGEFASDFDVVAYNPEGVVVLAETVIGNKSVVYGLEKPLDNYNRIKIIIKKWGKPKRRVRIIEVDFGLIREYSGEKLISLKVLEEMDLLASTVPSNEMQFVLDNSDNAFNILNPNGIYRFLKPNQEMTAQLGLLIGTEKYEFIPMGNYFLSEWTVEEGAMTSTFVGRDIFTKLDMQLYTNLLQETNLYDLAVDVLTQAKVEKFVIDEGFREINTFGFHEAINTREALQMIAIAGQAVIRQNRFGYVVFEKLDALAFESGYTYFAGPDLYAGTISAQVDIDYRFQSIDFDNVYEVPKISLSPAVSHIILKIYDNTGEIGSINFLNPKVKEGQGYEINNPLINSAEHAEKVAKWMFREYNLISDYQANWRQNPALECGNIILIEDSFGGNKKSRITKNEFNFSGYLQGMTEAKGGV